MDGQPMRNEKVALRIGDRVSLHEVVYNLDGLDGDIGVLVVMEQD